MSLPLVDTVTGGPHAAVGLRGKLVLGAPGNALAITPGDGPIVTDAQGAPIPVLIYVGAAAASDVTVLPYGGGPAVEFFSVPPGTMLPVAVIAVTAASAGSPDLVAIW